MLLEYIKGFKR